MINCFLSAILFTVILGTWKYGSRVPRVIWWLAGGLLLCVTAMVNKELHPLVRMVLFCTFMLGWMKCIVYTEWQRQTGKRLTYARWLMFSTLWFGMDPGVWSGKKKVIAWHSHFLIGMLYLTAGITLCALLVYSNVQWLITSFIALSLIFHYGVLRWLVAFWRALGIPVRALFRNPLGAIKLSDFWSKRWNLAFSQMMARAVQKPLRPLIGNRWAVFVVFIVSGILHEIAITLPIQGGYGLPTLYFTLHGSFVIFENKITNNLISRVVTLLLIIVPLPLLFPSQFTHQIIFPCLNAVGSFILNLT